MGVGLLVAGALLAAACGGDDDDDADAAAEGDAGAAQGAADAATSCDRGSLTLVNEGQLTVGTDSPAFEPWFVDDDPSNGQGFESAVTYAVADELGFSADEVTWTVVPFNNAFAPGEKDFDFAIEQVSITEERAQAVDFSDGYYDVNQAIVGFSDSPAADATTVSELKGLKLGAQVGTTSLDFINQVIQPEQEASVYNDTSAAKAAFDAGQLDGLVLDLPTAFFVAAVEIEGAEVIGQFPSVGDDPEQFGMVFEKGNPLRDCVNEALSSLRDSGQLEAIEQEWLSESTNAPVISLDE